MIERLHSFLRRLICWFRCLFYRPPRYEPERWNDEGAEAEECTYDLATETTIQCKNNCYNYACNIQTNHKPKALVSEVNILAQPGQAGGYVPSEINCDEYTRGAKSDGLKKIAYDESCMKCCHKVALVIWPGVDFHWYRQDDNGRWSHKPGMTAARDMDNSGNPIFMFFREYCHAKKTSHF